MKEVIILGKGNSSAECPFDAEVWGINDVFKKSHIKGKRIDKLFAFDDWAKEYTDKLKNIAPLVSWRDYATEHYPIKEIIKEFKTEYFCNTASYMVALAIYLKYDKIRLYGIDHAIGSPWFEDRTGIEYWLGRAEQAGIMVEVPRNSQVLKSLTGKPYGYAGDSNITLYLHERAAIQGMLSRKGKADYIRIVNPLIFKISFTEAEVEEYGISVYRQGETMGFNCKSEVATEFILTPEEFAVIKRALVKLEKRHNLPTHYISLWEKFARQPHELGGGTQWVSRGVIKGARV